MTSDIIFTAIYLIALISIIGILICRFWVLPRDTLSMSPLLSVLRKFYLTCLSLITVTSLIVFLIRSINMNDGTIDNYPTLLSTVLCQTHFGHMMLLRFILLAILWLVALFTKNDSHRFTLPTLLMFLLSLSIAFTTSTISHAGDDGDFTRAVMIDWLHIFASSGWGGSITTVAICVLPFYSTLMKSPIIFAELIKRLSLVSIFFLTILLISGIYNAWWYLGTLNALWTSTAGRMLTLKLFFVFLMILIGAINKFILYPSIHHAAISNQATHAIRWINITIITDAVLLMFILGLTTIIIDSNPPGMMG